MCKLFAVVEIENKKNAEQFTKKAIPEITRTDNHGLGIMRLGENGVHIQRWLEPPAVLRQKTSPELKRYEKALKRQQNEDGNPSRELHAIAVHGRFATCSRSMENTHPFYKGGAALMHNGVISNALAFTRELSTCDSEALLSQYVEHKVPGNGDRLSDAMDGVAGYYAAMVFNNNGVIDIWRDDSATLFLAHVRGVGVVIATTKEIITKTARKCKAYITGIDEILPFTHIRWRHGVNPRIGSFESFQPPVALTPVAPDLIIEQHQNSVSDASDKHWWELEQERDLEAARVAKWKAEKDEQDKELSKFYDQTIERVAMPVKAAV